MDINANWLWFVVLALVLGLYVGAQSFPTEVKVDVPGDCPDVPACNPETETVYQNVTQEVEVTPVSYRDLALADFLEYLDDEELFACDGNEYSESETSVVRTDDEFSVGFDDEDYTVEFSTRLKYKESDLRSCRESYDVSAYYEEGEDPEITIL